MSTSPRILIIDDDENIRKTLELTLKNSGYQVDTAQNGQEAIMKADANFYNLALIDIRLPDMDGTQLLTSLRETTPRMVKIILTGYPALENAVRAINNRVDGYLIKPVKEDELLGTIKQHLDDQKEQKQLDQQKIAQFIDTRFRELNSQTNEKGR